MEEALKISGIGMFIVFFSLVIISIILSIMGHFFNKKNISGEMHSRAFQGDSIDPIDNEIPPEIIAVITAAISLSYGPCTRINSISTVHRESQYGMQGRMNIMDSHKLK